MNQLPEGNTPNITNIQIPENVLFCVIFPESVFELIDNSKKDNMDTLLSKENLLEMI